MRKNILLIIPFLTDGGAEKVVSELSIALNEFHNVFLLLFEDKVTYPFQGKKIVLDNSKKFTHPIYGLFNKVLFLRKLKRDNQIDCSISFLVIPNLINVLSRKKDKIILTVHTHLTEYYKRKTPFQRLKNKLQIRFFYNRADYVVGVSKGIEYDLSRHFKIKKNRLRTIYNFYNFTRINQLAEQSIKDEHIHLFSKPVIINVGRLTYSKGQWNLLNAIKIVKKEIDVNLLILGDGKFYHQYLEFIKNNYLEDTVFLLGFQTNPYPLIKSSTIFISCSKFEGLSNVILEALILKTPVIATDCISGPREILAPTTEVFGNISEIEYHPNGILLPLKHPEDVTLTQEYTSHEKKMASAIIKFLREDNLRLNCSENGVKRAEHFKVENQISNWLSLLN